MTCTVYPDHLYNRIAGTAFAALMLGVGYVARVHLHGDVIFQAAAGFIGLGGLAIAVSSFFTGIGPYYRADASGVFGRRPFKGTVPWTDVIDAELLPRCERQSDGETTFHLKEGWRPVLLTIREPGNHLRSPLGWVPPGGSGGEPARVRLEFTGLQPLSGKFHEAIWHHLALHHHKARQVVQG